MLNPHYSCDSCGRTNENVGSVGGMAGVELFRCNSCGATATVSVYDDRLTRLQSQLSSREMVYAAMPKNLRPCVCGGSFEHGAPVRCQFCRAPVNQSAFLTQTGAAWRDNMFIGKLAEIQWRLFCSNCGVEDESISHADTSKAYYVCSRCRANAV